MGGVGKDYWGGEYWVVFCYLYLEFCLGLNIMYSKNLNEFKLFVWRYIIMYFDYVRNRNGYKCYLLVVLWIIIFFIFLK